MERHFSQLFPASQHNHRRCSLRVLPRGNDMNTSYMMIRVEHVTVRALRKHVRILCAVRCLNFCHSGIQL